MRRDVEQPAFGQYATQEVPDHAQSEDARQEERDESGGEEILNDAPQLRNENQADNEHRVDRHSHREWHSEQLGFAVRVAEFLIGFGFLEFGQFAEVPDQVAQVLNDKEGNASHRCDDRELLEGISFGPCVHDVLKNGNGRVGVRHPEHQIHEESDSQSACANRGEEVEWRPVVCWAFHELGHRALHTYQESVMRFDTWCAQLMSTLRYINLCVARTAAVLNGAQSCDQKYTDH